MKSTSVQHTLRSLVSVAAVVLGMLAVGAPMSHAAPIDSTIDSATFHWGTASKDHGTVADPALASGWGYATIGSGYGACPLYKFCIWYGLNATAPGRAYGGQISCGDGISWRGSIFENHVGSIKNRTTIPVTVLNFVSGTSWQPIWYSPVGNYGNLPNGNKADGIGYIC